MDQKNEGLRPMDGCEIHCAPHKELWNDDSPVNTSKQWFSSCRRSTRLQGTRSESWGGGSVGMQISTQSGHRILGGAYAQVVKLWDVVGCYGAPMFMELQDQLGQEVEHSIGFPWLPLPTGSHFASWQGVCTKAESQRAPAPLCDSSGCRP